MDRPHADPAHPLPAEQTILCRCAFTFGDIADIWTEVVDDDEAELPVDVLQRLESSFRLVEEAMCQRGYDAIRSLLDRIVAGEEL
jgi:hypothetical protein